MSRNIGNRSATPRKSSTLLTGILLGMVIGVGLAAGLAWYIVKSPSPFIQKEQVASKLPAEAVKPPPDTIRQALPPSATPPAALSGVPETKPRFEFYKVLTDKQEPAATAPAKSVDKPQPSKPQSVDSKPITVKEAYFLQAGSFSEMGDAEKLKAKLAMIGVETSIHAATIPDKGVWHRVRIGPYTNIDEMNRTRNLLKQNGVDATPIRP